MFSKSACLVYRKQNYSLCTSMDFLLFTAITFKAWHIWYVCWVPTICPGAILGHETILVDKTKKCPYANGRNWAHTHKLKMEDTKIDKP